MVETEAARSAQTPAIADWTDAPWPKLERALYRLQKRIYTAQDRGNVKVVHSLQRLLLKSRAARMLAVRRVTQENQGKKTAGVDGVKAVGPLVRLLFVERLSPLRGHSCPASASRAHSQGGQTRPMAAFGHSDPAGPGAPDARQLRPGAAMGGARALHHSSLDPFRRKEGSERKEHLWVNGLPRDESQREH